MLAFYIHFSDFFSTKKELQNIIKEDKKLHEHGKLSKLKYGYRLFIFKRYRHAQKFKLISTLVHDLLTYLLPYKSFQYDDNLKYFFWE